MSDDKNRYVQLSWTTKASLPTSNDVLEKLYELREALLHEKALLTSALDEPLEPSTREVRADVNVDNEQPLSSGTGTDG